MKKQDLAKKMKGDDVYGIARQKRMFDSIEHKEGVKKGKEKGNGGYSFGPNPNRNHDHEYR